ncbi:MAG TPA: M13 family metallopeptidase, partial [Longimicrobiales bacterium]
GVAALALAAVVAGPAQAQQKQAPRARALGVDTANFDRSVRPQDDFARFVNGTWEKNAVMPGDRARWGSFDELRDRADAAIRTIVEQAAAHPGKPGSNMQKVGDFYASFMDTARIEALGLTPIEPQLASLSAIRSAADLPAAFARGQRQGGGGPFQAMVGADPRNSQVNIVSIGQGGLSLPDRDYYLRQDEKFAGIRKAYVEYITKLLTLAHQPDPAGAAQRILALETSLAEKQWDRARSRDREAAYNKMSVAQLQALTPSFGWTTFLADAGMGKATEVIVRQPDYLEAIDGILSSTPATTWREWLAFKTINGYAEVLPRAFGEARFDFSGRTLEGLQQAPARWKSGVGSVERPLGEAVGELYVARYFQPEAKARMDRLVHNILAAYKVAIDSLEWMSPATKAQAQAKLAAFTVKIGYPDKWRDYSKLEIKRGDAVGNMMRAREFQYADMIERLGKPVDHTRWGMTPQTENASYNASDNAITFPAGILQPPFFNVNADDATTYGAIGAVIGHEISHGFDDQGAKSDGRGNMRNWFTLEDLKAFKDRTTRLADEYSAYVPIDDIHINGRLTLGENIGDVSGIAVAYRAYHISLQGKEAPVIAGFTGDQRFFLGFAQIWRTKIRPEALRNQLLTDPHSPGQYRAFVPLTNFDPFYRAWNVQPGDKLWRAPEDRVKIW